MASNLHARNWLPRLMAVATAAMTVTFAFGQEVPDRNPDMNADGTNTYWCGNNMQWDIQEAIDDCSPGDIIVIRGGDYVNSLYVNKPNITIRPFVNENGEWETVNLWNPTQGPENDNGWAVYVGPDTENTYIGRPRQFRQLPNGFISETEIVPGEYMASPGTHGMEVDEVSGRSFTFWSRSVDNTGVMSDNGKATIELCDFTSDNGFGGGAMLVGDANDTAFVDCDFYGLYANGSTLRTDVEGLDMPNYCVSIHATGGTMEYTFTGCNIDYCHGSTIVYQDGGGGAWAGTNFYGNVSETNFAGVMSLIGCNPHFADCHFRGNLSGYGTVFFDGNGVSNLDGVRFTECSFCNNTTIDGQWGGVIYAVDANEAEGTAPKVMFDDCKMVFNNGHPEFDQDDIVSPWFPSYRQGDANEVTQLKNEDPCIPSADLNGDGIVDGADLGIIFATWGTDGTF
ncbi:MAG: hypothetical protein MK085_00870 [Phycisphaerales bacterium]|nr:hypothetical protein [Phycisphaerales bacterium]